MTIWEKRDCIRVAGGSGRSWGKRAWCCVDRQCVSGRRKGIGTEFGTLCQVDRPVMGVAPGRRKVN